MREQLALQLQEENNKLKEQVNIVEDAINTIKKISDLESEILDKVSDIKILKLRLLDNPYIVDKTMIDNLVMEEITAIENSIRLNYIELEDIGNHIGLEDIRNYFDAEEAGEAMTEEAMTEDDMSEEISTGKLAYIGSTKVINEIIEEQENKICAEKAIDASLEQAVQELESKQQRHSSKYNNTRRLQRRIR